MVQSAGLSVRPSHIFHYVPIIVSSHGQKKKSTIMTRIERFRIVTAASIHRRLWNDAQRFEGAVRGSLLFFKVRNEISMSHGPKNQQFHGFGSGLNKITRPVAAVKSLIFALLRSCYLCKYRYEQSLSVLTTDWTHTNRCNTFYQTVI